MDPYVFSLSLGAAGLGAMAVTGLAASHGADGATGHGAHAGHGHGHHASDVSLTSHHGVVAPHGAASHAHGAHGGHAHHAGHANAQAGRTHDADAGRAASELWTLLSPRVLFSLLVGAGATGLLLRDVLGLDGWLVPVLAVLGGVLFEAALVRPLWNFAFRFASTPALTLESSIMDEARAVSGFDRNGQGLIAVELDGQLVQVLGTLRPEDRELGVRVRAGDVVRIEEVDEKRNRCVVSYAGQSQHLSS